MFLLKLWRYFIIIDLINVLQKLSCREQFLAMSFGQLSCRESLRDTVSCLSAHKQKLYHLGFGGVIARSTLAEANEKRDWNIYWDFAQLLIKEARSLYVDDLSFSIDLENACYAVDSTSIDLCLSLFPWSPYMKTKGSIKLHMVLDMRGSIPTFFNMTNGKVSDVSFLDLMTFEPGAFYVMDRGYIDFARLYVVHKAGAFFVTRAKVRMRCKRRYSNKVNENDVRCDQIIFLTDSETKRKYPETLRRIKYYDDETEMMYVFLTNNFTVSAKTIADLYKNRWKVELFFKWIKQHLKIKMFWGHSENAVKTQICIAISSYLIVAILKKKLKIDKNIYEILQILSVSLFDKIPLLELFSSNETQPHDHGDENMATLFDC